MDKKRVSALALLKRLKKHEMEMEARKLGELRYDIALLEGQLQKLTESMQDTTKEFDAVMTPYMQQYLPAAKTEIIALHSKINHLEPHVQALEEQVSKKFNEFKTFDIIHNSASAEIHREEESREAAEIQETNLAQWLKRRRKLYEIQE